MTMECLGMGVWACGSIELSECSYFIHNSLTPLLPYTSRLPSLAAGVGIEGIVYLIILFFWVIAQFANRNKKRLPSADDERGPMSDEVREIFEQLTGQKLEVPRPPPPPPPPLKRQPESKPKVRPPLKPQTAQPQRRPPPSLEPRQREIVMPSLAEFEHEFARASTSPVALSSFSAAVKGIGSGGMKTVPLPMVGAAMLSQGDDRHRGKSLVPDLKNSHTLRNAIVSQIILGPPKAMERA